MVPLSVNASLSDDDPSGGTYSENHKFKLKLTNPVSITKTCAPHNSVIGMTAE